MNLIVLTEPSVEPVVLADVYSHLRLDMTPGSPASHPDDTMLTRHIKTARREVEKLTHRSLVSQQLRLVTSSYLPPNLDRNCYVSPALIGYPRNGVDLLRPPLISVDAVRYYDTGNVLVTVDPDDYFVTDDLVPKLVLKVGLAMYPRADAFRVDYTAGYAPLGSPPDYVANVPSEAKDAILLGVELLYEALSPEQRDRLILARDSLLSGLKVYSLA